MHAKNSTLNTRLLQYYFAKKGLTGNTGRDKENTRNAIKGAREDAKENYSEGGRFKSGNGNLTYITNQQRMSLVGELGDRRDESQRSNPGDYQRRTDHSCWQPYVL